MGEETNDSRQSAGGAARTYALPAVLAIVTVAFTALGFKNLDSALIAGLCVAALTMLYELRRFIATGNKHAEVTSSQAFNRLLSLLRIHNEFFQDDWLYQLLERIVRLRERSKQQPHGHDEFEEEIKNGLSHAEQIVVGEKLWYPREEEINRMARLKKAIDVARLSVFAVTYDANGYFDNFWRAIFGESYIASNQQAASRGVAIKRIFVVPQALLDDKTSEKYRRLAAVVSELVAIKIPNMTVSIAAAEDVKKHEPHDTSFLVSDDYVASESFTVIDGRDRDGYVCFGNEHAIRTLFARFNKLDILAGPPSKYGIRATA